MGSKRPQEKPKKMFVQLDDLMTGEKLAAQMNVTERCLRNWTKKGIHGVKLQRIKFGPHGRVYYDKKTVELFIAQLQSKMQPA